MTILAVVAGLAISGAGAISHNLYVNVLKNGKVDHKSEMKISKFATIDIGIFAILLGIVFENQNVAFTCGTCLCYRRKCEFSYIFALHLLKKFHHKRCFLGWFNRTYSRSCDFKP